MNPKVDELLNGTKKWKEEFSALRRIILDCAECGLEEDLKWGQPCYSFKGKNVVLIHGFKDYCALLFFKGALMADPRKLLIIQTDNVQASRQIRFTSLAQILELAPVLRAYVLQAVEVEKSGQKVEFKKTSQFSVPEEFQRRLIADPALKSAFEALTPGRQRAYLLFFAAPKQSSTRESRIEKCIPRIFDGIGLND